MPAKKRPRKDSVPCVAGSGSPTRASRGGVGYARAAQWTVHRQVRSGGARKATRLRGIKLLRKSKRRGRERKLVQCGPEALLAR
jgi:hypothetical protein